MWYCPQCSELRECTRETSISNCGHVLIIQLNRFSKFNGDTFKDTRFVECLPEKDHILTVPFKLDDDVSFSKEFSLVATMNHSSSLNAGHYWAIESLETRQQRYNSLEFATGPGWTGLVADAGKLRRLSRSQYDIIYFLPVAATSLRAGFQLYLSKLWVVDVTKEVRYDLLIYGLLSNIILHFLLVVATSLRAGFQVYLS